MQRSKRPPAVHLSGPLASVAKLARRQAPGLKLKGTSKDQGFKVVLKLIRPGSI